LIGAPTPPIRGIIESSLTHWDGRIVSVVFIGGCNLRCGGCPAPHLIGDGREQGEIPLDSVLDAIYRRRRWIDGVVIKGGEPLLSPEVPELLELLRDFGLEIRIDTNGTCPEALSGVIRRDLVDFVSMEVKAPLTPLYHRVAGTVVDLSAIFDSIGILLSGVVDYEFRTVVYDELLSSEDVLAIARTLKGARRYVLRAVPGKGPSRTSLRSLAKVAGRHVEGCHVDGRPQDRETLFAVFAEGDEA
jgi:pyruvate formate lyase activating enzyme